MNIQKKLLLVALTSAFAHSAQAADKYWVCGSGSWDTTCWSSTPGGAATLGQPLNGDGVYLTQSDATNRTVSYANTAYPAASLNFLVINATGAGTMTLSQTKDSLAATIEYIGLNGKGAFTQSGGTNTVSNNLSIGVNSGNTGSYTLSGTGNLSVANNWVGSAGTGTFTQSGGTHTVGSLTVGHGTGVGTYTLSGGVLSATNETIGRAGSGTFTQSGGTHTISSVSFAEFSGSSGTYTQNGGTLNVNYISAGAGNSTFNYNGGVLTLTNNISSVSGLSSFNVANAAGSNASFTIAGNQSFAANNVTIGNVGTGLFSQNGGTSTLGALTINNGTYKLAGGTLTVNTSLNNNGILNLVGGSLSSVGTLTQGATGVLSGRGTVGNVINNAGTINAKSGNLILNGGSFTNTGLVTNSVGSNLFIESLAVNHQGSIEVNSSGSVVFDAAISNKTGQNVTLLGGTLATPTLTNEAGGNVKGFGALTGNLTNAGSVEFYGPTNIVGEVLNQSGGTILVRNNQTLITGHTVNDGTIQTLKGTVIFEGGLTNNGAYLSDPSDNYFTDLTVSQSGYLVGEIGDNFLVSGNFINNSTQNTLWNTSAASLILSGATLQNVYLAGNDLGALAGYANNFAWGELSLVSGTSLKLWDGNGDPGAALYVGLLELGGGIGQISSIDSPYNIYYDSSLAGNAYLGGQTYALNGGGSLIAAQPVPEPATYGMLLAGLGLVGFAARRRQRRAVG